ncbi:MAG: 16S rRNA (adenine(1518)-N(6)/adenine(1519)-N(6))-dimethyltransferase RsmA [Clostridia bacterium]|nr:16S rRNA (adenine(1518)-N(6)/adenine(1519)-N(6))-dimethyltransferase RsmA [Clostridia bacterium]
MSLINETKLIMKKYNITAKKSLGQNFLINEEVVYGIVEKAEVTKDDLIIEIGPGLGTLTTLLVQKAGFVVAIELDKNMVNILTDRFACYENLEILNEDILKINLKSLIKERLSKYNLKTAKVVANLPYYISTPIIMKLLEDRLNINSITVMVQKEVAFRLVEKPGGKETGAITYSINYYSKPNIAFFVDKSDFIPVPEVDSAVIKLNIYSEPIVKVKSEKTMFKVIKIAFMQKRKTLLNSLYNGKIFSSREEILKMFKKLGIDEKVRGERLTIEKFAEIADYIEKYKSGDKNEKKI